MTREEYISLLPKNKRLAIKLHESLCHHDHTEWCSWFYEIKEGLEDDWSGYAHRDYLDRADRVLKVCDDEKMIIDLIEAMKYRWCKK